MTLKNPEKHSFHCLLDVPQCKDSGYVVLGDKNEATGMHSLGFRLDDAATVIQAGLAAGRKGYCTDCTGDSSKPEYGYQATVRGTVKELGDGTSGITGAPLLENIEMLDASVDCETSTTPPNPAPSSDLKVGDDVCVTNFIMDQFCIDLGTLLDDSDTMTLKNPEKHSFHCLLDVPQCKDSGYVVLGDKNEATGMHSLGFRLDDAATVIQAGLAAGRKGYCTDCTGDSSKPEYGYQATVRGTVKELGDGTSGITGAPLLENIEMLDASIDCGTSTTPTYVPTFFPTESPTHEQNPTDSNIPVLSCPDTLDRSIYIDDSATLFYAIAHSIFGINHGLFCGRLEVVDHMGWIAFAISMDDGDKNFMFGADAIIGIPGDDTVLKYDLTTTATAMSGDKQTLKDTSIAEEDGKTIMEFTKLLVEDGENPILKQGKNVFLHARGGSTLGYHGPTRFVFRKDFTAPDMVPTTPAPAKVIPAVTTPQPTLKPVTMSPTSKPVTEELLTASPTLKPVAKEPPTPTKSPTVAAVAPSKTSNMSPTVQPVAQDEASSASQVFKWWGWGRPLLLAVPVLFMM